MKKELFDMLQNGYWMPDSCPNCSGDVFDIRVRNKSGIPAKRRRKYCLNCKTVFHTVEMLVEPA